MTLDDKPRAPVDGRQSAAALDIARGVGRLLSSLGFAALTELPLPNGRRADVIGLSDRGDLWIIEIKSSIEDFRADLKWPEYLEFCDRLLFAVAPGFPRALLPEATGHIVADRYGGEIVRPAPEVRLPAARRKAMALRFGRAAAIRLQLLWDPDLRLERWPDA